MIDINKIPLPPAIYDKEPSGYYQVIEVGEAKLKEFCKYRDGDIALGCTKDVFIFIRKGLPKEVYDVVLRHEKGHVNGWVHP